MDNNYNYTQNLDGSLNLSGSGLINMPGMSGNVIGTNPNIENMQNFQNLTPQQLIQMHQINQQQIQQLTNQMTQLQMMGVNTSQMSPVLPVAPVSTTQFPGQFYGPPAMTSASVGLNSSLNMSLNGSFQTAAVTNPHLAPVSNPVADPNSTTGIYGPIHNPSQVQGYNSNAGQIHINGSGRNVATPNSLPLQAVHTGNYNGYPSSNYSSSTASTPQDSPATPKKAQRNSGNDATDSPTFMLRPRQQISSPPSVPPPAMSDRSSTSSASIPGSPISLGTPALSPDGDWSDASGPRSPEYSPRKGSTGEIKPQKSILNKPLQMKTRYPQDKCYTCMKKVYTMEKLGPVRGVVYHKLCFKCKICHTQLNLKNFFHNQSDSYDIAVYCKSHQPVTNDKAPRLDSNSFEIKSALSAPKAGTVIPQSERVPTQTYSYDITSRELEHARKVPVNDLQRGTKMRYHAWSKSKREKDSNQSPIDVVRYDEPVPEYDPESYTMHQVENSPDYT